MDLILAAGLVFMGSIIAFIGVKGINSRHPFATYVILGISGLFLSIGTHMLGLESFGIFVFFVTMAGVLLAFGLEILFSGVNGIANLFSDMERPKKLSRAIIGLLSVFVGIGLVLMGSTFVFVLVISTTS